MANPIANNPLRDHIGGSNWTYPQLPIRHLWFIADEWFSSMGSLLAQSLIVWTSLYWICERERRAWGPWLHQGLITQPFRHRWPLLALTRVFVNLGRWSSDCTHSAVSWTRAAPLRWPRAKGAKGLQWATLLSYIFLWQERRSLKDKVPTLMVDNSA